MRPPWPVGPISRHRKPRSAGFGGRIEQRGRRAAALAATTALHGGELTGERVAEQHAGRRASSSRRAKSLTF